VSDRSEMPTHVWLVEESGFDRERVNFYETLFTVGNGRLGVAIQQGAAAGGSQAPVVNSRVRAS
jgi:trehalose/maltose hydrolase-like predicted phosphorylase